jgi:hypothetical protein
MYQYNASTVDQIFGNIFRENKELNSNFDSLFRMNPILNIS